METTTKVNGNGSAIAVREERPVAALSVAGGVRIDSLPEVWRLAEALAHARGFVPKAMLGDPNGIAAAILTGMELGIGPMQALRSIHMVDGKPTMAADFMLARAIDRGVRLTWLRADAKAAIVRLERAGFAPYTQSFTIEEARDAGLAAKDNWRKYPAAMLRARCISAAMRAFCPDVLGPGVYVEGEIEESETTEAYMRGETVPGGVREVMLETRRNEPASSEGIVAPEKLSDCRDEGEVLAWCETRAPQLAKAGEKGRAYAKRELGKACERTGTNLGLALARAGLLEEKPAEPSAPPATTTTTVDAEEAERRAIEEAERAEEREARAEADRAD